MRVLVALACLALLTSVLGLALHLGNREVAPPTLPERQASLTQAIRWALSNEAFIASNGNLPLWWMLHEAAVLSGDGDLQALVARQDRRILGVLHPGDPWARLLNAAIPAIPGAIPEAHPAQDLEPYQQAFLSALTCGGMDPRLAQPGAWRVDNQCRPNPAQALVLDKVCSTHQLMALMLWRRQGCGPQARSHSLADELRSDILVQLRWDPIVKDAYIQRVLTLYWSKGEAAVAPIWLHRVMAAQQTNGGWMGRVQFPELPETLQPWAVRQALARQWPAAFDPTALGTDLHATAQGLLLMALATWSAQHPGQALPSAYPMP
jgi:hypothetical protein